MSIKLIDERKREWQCDTVKGALELVDGLDRETAELNEINNQNLRPVKAFKIPSHRPVRS